MKQAKADLFVHRLLELKDKTLRVRAAGFGNNCRLPFLAPGLQANGVKRKSREKAKSQRDQTDHSHVTTFTGCHTGSGRDGNFKTAPMAGLGVAHGAPRQRLNGATVPFLQFHGFP